MKTLAEFLARHTIDKRDYYNDEAAYQDMLKFFANEINEGIEAYKKHLQKDSPKTVQWAMIEKSLISALEKMQSHNHLNEKESDLGKVKHPICPLNMYFEGDENKIDLDKCDFENCSCSEECKIKKFGESEVGF